MSVCLFKQKRPNNLIIIIFYKTMTCANISIDYAYRVEIIYIIKPDIVYLINLFEISQRTLMLYLCLALAKNEVMQNTTLQWICSSLIEIKKVLFI